MFYACFKRVFEVGDPKFLDGGRADLIACRPEAPLGLDYLETMWYASEELLRPGGRRLLCYLQHE